MKRILIASALLLTVAASAPAADGKAFGKPLTGLPAVELADVLAKPEAGKLVRLEGTIDSVCQERGCWLELKQGTKAVHVTFEGYSFFVPKDSMGKKVALEGRVLVQEPKPEEVSHKQAEGAKSVGQKVSIEAIGVEIR